MNGQRQLYVCMALVDEDISRQLVAAAEAILREAGWPPHTHWSMPDRPAPDREKIIDVRTRDFRNRVTQENAEDLT